LTVQFTFVSKRRISSHCDVSGLKQISEVLLAGPALPVEGIRFGGSANNFYSTDGNYRKLPLKEGDPGVNVSRRLADQEPRQNFAVDSVRRNPSVDTLKLNLQKSNINP
jgi:hypothetical protein